MAGTLWDKDYIIHIKRHLRGIYYQLGSSNPEDMMPNIPMLGLDQTEKGIQIKPGSMPDLTFIQYGGLERRIGADEDFTFYLRYKFPTTNIDEYEIMRVGTTFDGTAGKFELYIMDNHLILADSYKNNVIDANISKYDDKKWHHLALSRYRNTLRAYIDGHKIAEVKDNHLALFRHTYYESQYDQCSVYIMRPTVLQSDYVYFDDFTVCKGFAFYRYHDFIVPEDHMTPRMTERWVEYDLPFPGLEGPTNLNIRRTINWPVVIFGRDIYRNLTEAEAENMPPTKRNVIAEKSPNSDTERRIQYKFKDFPKVRRIVQRTLSYTDKNNITYDGSITHTKRIFNIDDKNLVVKIPRIVIKKLKNVKTHIDLYIERDIELEIELNYKSTISLTEKDIIGKLKRNVITSYINDDDPYADYTNTKVYRLIQRELLNKDGSKGLRYKARREVLKNNPAPNSKTKRSVECYLLNNDGSEGLKNKTIRNLIYIMDGTGTNPDGTPKGTRTKRNIISSTLSKTDGDKLKTKLKRNVVKSLGNENDLSTFPNFHTVRNIIVTFTDGSGNEGLQFDLKRNILQDWELLVMCDLRYRYDGTDESSKRDLERKVEKDVDLEFKLRRKVVTFKGNIVAFVFDPSIVLFDYENN